MYWFPTHHITRDEKPYKHYWMKNLRCNGYIHLLVMQAYLRSRFLPHSPSHCLRSAKKSLGGLFPCIVTFLLLMSFLPHISFEQICQRSIIPPHNLHLHFFRWKARSQNLLAQLLSFDADVLCLQVNSPDWKVCWFTFMFGLHLWTTY